MKFRFERKCVEMSTESRAAVTEGVATERRGLRDQCVSEQWWQPWAVADQRRITPVMPGNSLTRTISASHNNAVTSRKQQYYDRWSQE